MLLFLRSRSCVYDGALHPDARGCCSDDVVVSVSRTRASTRAHAKWRVDTRNVPVYIFEPYRGRTAGTCSFSETFFFCAHVRGWAFAASRPLPLFRQHELRARDVCARDEKKILNGGQILSLNRTVTNALRKRFFVSPPPGWIGSYAQCIIVHRR